jgi:hypothetical protein
MNSGQLNGTGRVKCGPRNLGTVPYRVEIGSGGQASVVTFAHRLNAKHGDTVHLTLEDGRMLDCQVLDASQYCAVVGDGPYLDRRRAARR